MTNRKKKARPRFMYCWRGGQIRIGRKVPEGAIRIATGSERRLRNALWATGRLAYDNKTFLVPGIPEAGSSDQALVALGRYRTFVRSRLVRRAA